MAVRKISPEQFGEVLNDILTDYAEQVTEDVNDAVIATGKMTVKVAKAYANRIGRGKYATSLSMQEDAGAGRVMLGKHVTIYSKQYRLAHLLEHGHVVKAYGKIVGTARAFPHFAPAEAMAESMLESKVKQAIGGNS